MSRWGNDPPMRVRGASVEDRNCAQAGMRSTSGVQGSIRTMRGPTPLHSPEPSEGNPAMQGQSGGDEATKGLVPQQGGSARGGSEAGDFPGGADSCEDLAASGHSSLEEPGSPGHNVSAGAEGLAGQRRVDSRVDLSSLGGGGTGGIWDASPAEMESFRRPPGMGHNVSPSGC